MDDATFWQLVLAAQGPGGDDAHAARLRERLLSLPPEEIARFDLRFRELHASAVRQELRAAGMLLNRGHGSDDGFKYFRNWLISRGRATFESALVEPDSLADIPMIADSSAEFESFGYAASEAYHLATGRELEFSQSEVAFQQVEAQDYRDEPDAIRRQLPRLWSKYAAEKLRFDEEVARVSKAMMAADGEAVQVPGLGILRVGDEVMHRRFGRGTIKKMMRLPPFVAVVAFEDGDHSMKLDAAFYK